MRRAALPTALALSALALGAALVGCSAEDEASGSITVFAAASLTESFTTLGEQFEEEHLGTTVTFSFAGSSALATQIQNGAPADVFASASETNMDQVVEAGDAADPTTFAVNSMEIAVPPSNPGGVDALDDLAGPSVTTALCQPQVPCGVTAQAVFDNAGITVTPVTQEPDVKAVLTKVSLGEVDAGMVYVTDVRGAGDDVVGIRIADDVNATTSYPIATLTAGTNAKTAQAFVDYVLSSAGKAVLSDAGFAQP